MNQEANKVDWQMVEALQSYKKKMVEDYRNWTIGKGEATEDKNKRIEDFDKGIRLEKTQLYWKVLNTDINGTSKSVHSFIVKEDRVIRGIARKRGDILKAASWSSPAHNFIRGNILGDYKVRWVGTAI